MKKILFFITISLSLNASNHFYYQNNKKVFLTPLEISQNFQKIDSNQTDKIHFYKTAKGQIVGISKELIVKIKEEKVLDSLVVKYQVIVKKKLAQKLYLMEIKSTEKTLDICNKLYQENNVSYAHPNFIKRIVKR
jgi:hypothetical protein